MHGLLTNGTLETLKVAPYGAYAMNMNQRIVFWNRTAEVLTGHRSDQVIGRPCYVVLQNRLQEGTTTVCMDGCPSILLARCGRVPSVMNVQMLCASGERKEMTITSVLLPNGDAGSLLLLHLFHEMTKLARAKIAASTVREALLPMGHSDESIGLEESTSSNPSISLTSRQLEVLRLFGLGLSLNEIAHHLFVSTHTVRNHIYGARVKLGVSSTLDAVLAARRRGLL